jgi:hypothetical protein
LILAQNLDQVFEKQLPLCIRDGAAVFNQISNEYNAKGGVNFRASPDFQQVYEDLRSGRCDMMATRAGMFSLNLCSIKQARDPF